MENQKKRILSALFRVRHSYPRTVLAEFTQGHIGQKITASVFDSARQRYNRFSSTVPRETFMGLDTVRKHNITYYNIPAAFDIETTSTIKDGGCLTVKLNILLK